MKKKKKTSLTTAKITNTYLRRESDNDTDNKNINNNSIFEEDKDDKDSPQKWVDGGEEIVKGRADIGSHDID